MALTVGGTFSPKPPPLTPKVTSGGFEGPGPRLRMAGVARTARKQKSES